MRALAAAIEPALELADTDGCSVSGCFTRMVKLGENSRPIYRTHFPLAPV